MGESVREFSGRKFTAEDISLIVETTKMYPKLSQKELASTVCEIIEWQTPDRKPKRVQCVDFLRQLEAEGLISLPEIRLNMKRDKKGSKESSCTRETNETNQSIVTHCGAIGLEMIRPGVRMSQWREYVRKYHVLGDPIVAGTQIRYMITSEGLDLGCLLFSASSLALAPREEWIGWTLDDKKSRLHLILNNSRFLLFPWVRVRYLASRALSQAARQIQKDWLSEFCYAPVLLETFVDIQYKATSYKASNWIYLGETQGRGRNDRYFERLLTQKAIYVLPLQRDFRDILKGEKPYKVVSSDE